MKIRTRRRAWVGLAASVMLGCGSAAAPAGDPDAAVIADIDAAIGSVDAALGPDAEPCTGTMTFAYTGAAQTFAVPTCAVSIVVEAYGAAGASLGTSLGGLGGGATARIPVTGGEDLTVIVGGAGFVANTPEFGGFGGGGGAYNFAGDADSATGGGASDVRRGAGLDGRLIVAGGGGGGGYRIETDTPGGAGGGLMGGDGTGQANPADFFGGGGGTQSAGGAVGWAQGGYNNEPGTFGQGGRCWHDGAGCGGGGGGYYGGGTGGFAGGGGGSGFVDAAGNTETSMQVGVQAGDGVVTISW